jgi:hypothetical protein
MKRLGTLFGVDILLDTDDEKVFKLAERHLQDMDKKANRAEIDPELAKRLGIPTKTYQV